MQKQKICHIINSLDFGGIETIVRDFSNYDPTVNVIIFQKKGSDIFTETVDSNVPVYFVKSGWFNCIKILKIMKAHNCNKICSHVFSNIFEMILLHFLSSTQILQVLHSEYQLNLLSKLKNIIAYRLALFFGIKVICVSNGVAQYALNNLKLHNVSVIYNGIDASKFYYDTTKRHDKFIVVHIGSFTYPKNHKLLIKIFHEFYLTNSNARLRLVGDGALLDDIKKQVRTCGLEEVVEFCGAVVDVPNCISGGSVFLFPSLFEGFGKAVIEAMSMGIVPIISDYPAAHEIIEHKKHGYIVKDQDVSRYVRYLTRLSQDEELHTTMAQMCRNRVNNKFTMKKMIEEYYDA